MHLRFDITISFLDIFILAYLVYTVWIGYRIGGLVKAMALFALSAGLLLSASLSFLTFRYFKKASIAPEIFSAFVLMVTFGLSVWFSEYVQKNVYLQTKDVPVSKFSKILGAIFAFAKSYTIVAIFSMVLLSFNVKGQFLPPIETRSFFANFTEWSMATVVRMLRPLHCVIQATYEPDVSSDCAYYLSPSTYNSIKKNQNQQKNKKPQNKPPKTQKPQQQNQINPNKSHKPPISQNSYYGTPDY